MITTKGKYYVLSNLVDSLLTFLFIEKKKKHFPLFLGSGAKPTTQRLRIRLDVNPATSLLVIHSLISLDLLHRLH